MIQFGLSVLAAQGLGFVFTEIKLVVMFGKCPNEPSVERKVVPTAKFVLAVASQVLGAAPRLARVPAQEAQQAPPRKGTC